MIYRLLFKFFILTFLFLSIANVVVISSGRMQVGTPVCQIYREQSGRKCVRLYCDATGVTLSSSDTCYDNNGNATRPSEQYDLICEPTPPCRVTVPIYCNPGNRSAEYEKECNGETETVSSRYIYCPLSCTCSAPQGTKPCNRATWNTTSCNWNISRCRDIGGGECLSGKTISGETFSDQEPENACSPCNPSPAETYQCQLDGGAYDWSSCRCLQTPIVIDVLGNGFDLTNAAHGVRFDINGDGTREQIAWSSTGSDDSWLALDRNGNNSIDNGKELFGNSTEQPAPPDGEQRNGFLALAVFDKIANGGNDDGKINQQDLVFANLRLWQDANHNGISETEELKTLTESGLAKIELDYRESRRTDEHGNQFKYRAKVKDRQDAQIGRWAWDVYLIVQPSGN